MLSSIENNILWLILKISSFDFYIFSVVELQGNFTFIQSAKIKDFVTDLHLTSALRADSATTRCVRHFYSARCIFCHTNSCAKIFLKHSARLSSWFKKPFYFYFYFLSLWKPSCLFLARRSCKKDFTLLSLNMILSYPPLSNHILSHPDLSNHILPYPIISYPILTYRIFVPPDIPYAPHHLSLAIYLYF